jgi:hypothetical protein
MSSYEKGLRKKENFKFHWFLIEFNLPIGKIAK